MRSQVPALAFASVLGLAIAAGAGCSSKPKVADVKDVVAVTVDKSGFNPSSIPAKRGRAITLTFTRTTDETCATEVVIASEHIRQPLPLNTAVSVSFIPEKAGDVRFACPMNMVTGDVQVIPPELPDPIGSTVAVVSQEDELSSELASLTIRREVARPRGRASTRTARSLPRVASLLWTIVAILTVGGGGYGAWLRRDRLLAPSVQVATVTTVAAAQAEVKLVATGYVVSRKKALLAPKVAGRLARLLVVEGQEVKEGQLVAELERADGDAQLAQAKADVASAKARIERARADVLDADRKNQREAELLQRKAGTAAAVEDADSHAIAMKAQVVAAEAEAAASETRVRSAEVALDNLRVRAPFDGTVLHKLAEVGEMLLPTAAGGATTAGAIASFAALDDLEVETDVSESQLGKVHVPDPRGGTGASDAGSPAEIVLDAFPDRPMRGVATEVRPTVDRAKATVVVKVRFVDATPGVLPDMSAKVSFLARALDEKQLHAAPKRVVPLDTIAERDGHKVVFVVDGDATGGVVRSVPLAVESAVGGGLVAIDGGPGNGVPLVRSPSSQLVDGMKVKIVTPN